MAEFDVGDQITTRMRFLINKTQIRLRPSIGDLVLELYSVSGYTAGDVLLINPGGKTQESRAIASISSLAVTLTAATSLSHAAGEEVGELVDPTTVQLEHYKPDGTTATYTYALAEITKDSTGIYSKLLTLATAGNHVMRWSSTGTVILREEQTFTVRDAAF